MGCACFTFVHAINSIAECIFDQSQCTVTSYLLGYYKAVLVPFIKSKALHSYNN